MLKIKPTMSSAQTYLSSNVVDRLTRVVGGAQHQQRHSGSGSGHSLLGGGDDSMAQYFDPPSATNERPILDMASFMGSLGAGAGPKAGEAGNSFNTPGKPGNGNSINGRGQSATAEGKAKRDAKFEMFLARQQANLKKRADAQKLVSN